MSYIPKMLLSSCLVVVGLIGFSGCGTKDARLMSLKEQLSAGQERIQELETSNAQMERNLTQKDEELERQRQAMIQADQKLQMAQRQEGSPPDARVEGNGDLFPPEAKAGQCYARALAPPIYKTEAKRVLKREKSERLDIVPATYEWVDEQVMVKSATTKLELVPATYEWVEEKVMVRPAATRMEEVPAVKEITTKRVVDQPAHTVWKKGRGPLEKIDAITGEILCLVEVPATYKTVTQTRIKKPASIRKIEIPAEYQTTRKQVMKTPPSTRTVTIPAVYKTVRVKKLVTPAQVKRIAVPAEYETVNQRIQVADGTMAWRPVLCETNTTPGAVRKVQLALQKATYYHAAIDGIYGSQTKAAVESYQRANGLAVGGMTIETLQSLGLKVKNNRVMAQSR